MREIELKTDKYSFELTLSGKKPWEIRLNDRDYQDGDILILKETVYTGEEMRSGASLIYTGRTIRATVMDVFYGAIYGLLIGWVIMTVKVEETMGIYKVCIGESNQQLLGGRLGGCQWTWIS